MYKTEEGFELIRGAKLFYRYSYLTLDRPTMVVVPGGPGLECAAYESFLSSFTEQVNMLFFDPRGCGKSPLRENPNEYHFDYTIDDLAELISVLNKKLGFGKVIMHGTSAGSMIAQGFAGRYPEMLEKLILVTGAPSYEFITLAKEQLALRGDDQQKVICEKHLWTGMLDENSMAEFLYQLSPLYLYTIKQKVQGLYGQTSLPVLNNAFKTEFYHFDYTSGLKNIACPTLIMAGRHDWINPPVLAEKTHAHIKNSILVIFEEAAHSLPRDMPEKYYQTIEEFLRS